MNLMLKIIDSGSVTPKIIEDVFKLEKSLIDDPTPLLTKKQLTACLKNHQAKTFLLYIAHRRNKQSSFVGYSIIQNRKEGWYLPSMAIAKKYRKKGYGKLLTNLRIYYAQLNSPAKKRKIFMHCGARNRPIQQLYISLGFKVSKRIKKYFANGEDALEIVQYLLATRIS